MYSHQNNPTLKRCSISDPSRNTTLLSSVSCKNLFKVMSTHWIESLSWLMRFNPLDMVRNISSVTWSGMPRCLIHFWTVTSSRPSTQSRPGKNHGMFHPLQLTYFPPMADAACPNFGVDRFHLILFKCHTKCSIKCIIEKNIIKTCQRQNLVY